MVINRLRSWTNEFFFQSRSLLRFRRPSYRERGEPTPLTEIETVLAERYGMQQWVHQLSPFQLKRNLATLWILDAFESWDHFLKNSPGDFLEVGCQDFSRLPALKAFLNHRGVRTKITGIEVDAYPILSDFHSRWDRAQYYRQLLGFQDEYLVADFFKYQKTSSGLFCFFPFVSENPALCWGLPTRFADARKWLTGFLNCLNSGGFLFVVHQGGDEQEVFDQVRSPYLKDLVLVERHQLSCPFLPPKIPSYVSLYRRA